MIKMKIAILHHDIEPPELKFKELFEKRGCIADLFDIRSVSEEQLLSYDLIFNRVYSSIASRDFNQLKKTLVLLKNLEQKGIRCVNSSTASLADYSKFELFKFLSANGIFTPPTIFLGFKNDIKKKAEKAVKEFGLPIVVKRNCGGKSYDVTKIYSLDELINTLEKNFKVVEKQGYRGGFILQKFIKSIREHDSRVAVIDGKFAFSYARSFVARNSDDKWIASTSGGSYEFEYESTDKEKEISIKANLVIRASFSESDVILTENGPCIIEVNLTPGYFMDNIEDIERMEIVVDMLILQSPIVKKVVKVEAD